MGALSDFLTPKRAADLVNELQASRLFQDQTATDRRSLLINLGLKGALADLNLEGSDPRFFRNLWAALSEVEIPEDGERIPGVIALLARIVALNPGFQLVSTEHAAYFETVLTQYATWKSSRTPAPRPSQTDRVASALANQRARRAAARARGAAARIDWDMVVDFDMDDQVKHVARPLSQRTGIFAFLVRTGVSSFPIYELVLQRIEREIRKRSGAAEPVVKRVDVRLSQQRLDGVGIGYQLIEKRLLQEYPPCKKVVDLFAADAGDGSVQVDVLLIVWNHDLPHPEMARIASAFRQAIYPQLRPCLDSRPGRFISFWINQDSQPLDESDAVVPPLERYDGNVVVAYFDGLLRGARIGDREREQYLEQLRQAGGRLPETYMVMQNITLNLAQGGTV